MLPTSADIQLSLPPNSCSCIKPVRLWCTYQKELLGVCTLSLCLLILMHCPHLPAVMVYHTCHITAALYHVGNHCVGLMSESKLIVSWQCLLSCAYCPSLAQLEGKRDGRNDGMVSGQCCYRKRLSEGGYDGSFAAYFSLRPIMAAACSTKILLCLLRPKCQCCFLNHHPGLKV